MLAVGVAPCMLGRFFERIGRTRSMAIMIENRELLAPAGRTGAFRRLADVAKQARRAARLAPIAVAMVLSGCQIVVSGPSILTPEVERLLTTNECGGCNLRRALLARADLAGAELTRADLTGARLTYAVLVGANLHWADLNGADLFGADLRGANLKFADLPEADLGGADLTDADLTFADLYGASLRGADLRGADLFGVDMDNDTDFTGANLFRAHGLIARELAEAITCRTIMPDGEIDNADCP